MKYLLLLVLAGCGPSPSECCIDPNIPSTCAKYLYGRDGATMKKVDRCETPRQ